MVEGQDDMLIHLARCCSPVPGDPIVGYVTVGRGVSVHRADCTNVASLADRRERAVEVSGPVTMAVPLSCGSRRGARSNSVVTRCDGGGDRYRWEHHRLIHRGGDGPGGDPQVRDRVVGPKSIAHDCCPTFAVWMEFSPDSDSQ